ncbi:MAG: bifunctional DNA-binding transcriptional regulator/O6-methylguanine-DNA methyltransferase Ada [Pirellulaceae bacterium]
MITSLAKSNLPTKFSNSRTLASGYSSDEERWQAVLSRDAAADGAFLYSVRTTGVYCRPNCAARTALRKNVRFHVTCQEAERAGFRPCKRCRPMGANLAQRHAGAVAQACRLIEDSAEVPSLDELAQSVGLSRYHLHRLFKAQTGVTPKAYAAAQLARRVRNKLATSSTVTAAFHDAGFRSSSRLYENSTRVLGMTPKTFRSGGAGTAIRFAIGECWLGSILVAASDQGVCAILLGDDPEELARDLQERFSKAELIGGDKAFERLIAKVVGFIDAPQIGLHLPLDIRGTAFQQRVWQALREIPAGTTASYTEVAHRIGRPKAVRAVARACAANPLAVAIPCHRVVRTSGELSGYRWGVERKDKLLRRERKMD